MNLRIKKIGKRRDGRSPKDKLKEPALQVFAVYNGDDLLAVFPTEAKAENYLAACLRSNALQERNHY